MCGRFAQTKINKVIRLNWAIVGMPDMFQGRFNIAPMQNVPAILPRAMDAVVPLKWGFESPHGGLAINARVETVHERHMFWDLERCMILSDGFYEWRSRQPYFFQLPDRSLFAFAGLCRKDQCVVVTRAASEDVTPIHSRMPVILTEKEDCVQWLESSQPPELPPRLICHPVSKRVNKAENDDPSLIEPAPGQSEFDL
jgi:putative SOS response-associated peptidase YedK